MRVRAAQVFVLGAMLLFVSSDVSAQAVVYNVVDRAIGSNGMVSGTIATDGTTGTLAPENILSVDLTLTYGALSEGVAGSGMDTSYPIAPPNVGALVGAGLIATATELRFDFESINSVLVFGPALGTFWCLDAYGGGNCFLGLDRREFVSVSGSSDTVPRTGSHVIATALPSVPTVSPILLIVLPLILVAATMIGRRDAHPAGD